MRQLGSVYVKGKVPKITYKGAVTRNLDLDYEEDENAPTKKSYVYFFGIPYGEPPVEEKRLEPPEPYKRRSVNKFLPYDATKSKPNYCFQRDVDDIYIGSEDCLYLNIYLPKKPKYISIFCCQFWCISTLVDSTWEPEITNMQPLIPLSKKISYL